MCVTHTSQGIILSEISHIQYDLNDPLRAWQLYFLVGIYIFYLLIYLREYIQHFGWTRRYNFNRIRPHTIWPFYTEGKIKPNYRTRVYIQGSLKSWDMKTKRLLYNYSNLYTLREEYFLKHPLFTIIIIRFISHIKTLKS